MTTKNQAEHENEIIDLVDDRNQVIGSVVRKDCHGNPALQHRAVHVFVVNSAGQYCLQKRSPAKRIQPGKWDTSVGGHIPAGESYEQGALRELAEELGICLTESRSLIFCHEYVWRSPVETEHVRTYILSYDGTIRFEPVEISETRFWSPDELRAGLGTGGFTPNLEEELKRLGLAG